MSWIAPYSHGTGLAIVNSNSEKFARGLSRIGLQYWVPTYSGGVTFHPSVDDAAVNAVLSWARPRHVAVLLCVYNGQSGWDWNLAVSAVKAGNGETLANALVAEMDRLGLDGVDIDLEGGAYNNASDREVFKTFIAKLAALVRARGKVLTVDTFHSTCWNSPNVSWWADWAGKVHNVHSMGYQDLYEGNTDAVSCGWAASMTNAFRYSTQQSFGMQGGYPADGVLMGMPGGMDSWGTGGRGSSATDHIAEVAAVGTGVAIWSIDELKTGSVWLGDAAWSALANLRGDACGYGNDADCTW